MREPARGSATERRYSPAISPHSDVPRVRWDPSPCGRFSRPRSTTVPLPRSGGHSGRCACPDPFRSAGTAGALPTFAVNRSAGSASSYTPVASPRGTATRRAASLARWVSGRARRPPSVKEDRAPRQPIAASFGAGDESRGFNHWFDFSTPFCLACGPGPLAADRSYVVGAAPTRIGLTSGTRAAPSFNRPSRRPAVGLSSHPVQQRLVAHSRPHQRSTAGSGRARRAHARADRRAWRRRAERPTRSRSRSARDGRQGRRGCRTRPPGASCRYPASSRRTTHCVDPLPERVRLVARAGWAAGSRACGVGVVVRRSVWRARLVVSAGGRQCG